MTSISNTDSSNRLKFKVLLIPILIEQFFGLLLSNIDVLMLSQYSDHAVAAVGMSNQMLGIAFMLTGIITIGCSIQLYQMHKEKHFQQVTKVINHIFYLTLSLSIVVSIVFWVFGRQLLQLMQTPEELIDSAYQYLTIVGVSLVFQSMISSISTVLRSFANIKLVMYISVTINVINIIGNYLVLNTSFSLLGKGIEGVAYSTLIARVIGSIVIVLYFISKYKLYRSALLKIKLTRGTTKSILKLGFPSAMENISYNSSQTIITAIIATLGAIMVTTKIYASTISLIIFAVAASISTANQIIVGKMIGQNNKEDAAKYTKIVLRNSFFVAIILALLIAIFGENIIRLFTANEEIIRQVKILLWLGLLLEPARTLNEILVGAINVAGEVKYPTYLNIIVTYIFVVPVCILLSKYMNLGLNGIWLIFIIDEWVRAILLLVYWNKGKWKKIKVISD